jgi:hypothetical protein
MVMKKTTLFLITMVFAGFLMSAKAVDVTFQVNMNKITDMHPGGSVWLLFGDWAQYYYMDDTDTDGIYTYTVDTTANDTLHFSFSYQTGPDEWNDYVQETVPGDCAGAQGYREVVVPASDTTLPAYYYETCSDLLTVEVTLSVDLKGVTDMYEDGGVWVYTSTDWSEWGDMSDEDGD